MAMDIEDWERLAKKAFAASAKAQTDAMNEAQVAMTFAKTAAKLAGMDLSSEQYRDYISKLRADGLNWKPSDGR